MSEAALKALGLVEVVARNSVNGLGGMEAAAVAGLDKSTASRLLRTLTERGWLMRDPRTRRYFPGRVLLSVARSSGFSQETHAFINTALEALRDSLNETVALHQRTGVKRVCVSGFESREEVRTGVDTADSRPLDRGASGKVILAFCERQLRDELLQAQEESEAQRTATQLRWTQEHGYLSTESENTWGVSVISVPLFDRVSVLGSLTVAGPSWRFDEQKRLDSLPELFDTAKQVTQALGGSVEVYDRWPLAAEVPANGEVPHAVGAL